MCLLAILVYWLMGTSTNRIMKLCGNQGTQFLLIGRQLFCSMKQREFLFFHINRKCVLAINVLSITEIEKCEILVIAEIVLIIGVWKMSSNFKHFFFYVFFSLYWVLQFFSLAQNRTCYACYQDYRWHHMMVFCFLTCVGSSRRGYKNWWSDIRG